jgi:hypothetical protein
LYTHKKINVIWSKASTILIFPPYKGYITYSSLSLTDYPKAMWRIKRSWGTCIHSVYIHWASQTDSASESLHLIVNECFISRNLPQSRPYNFINTTVHVNAQECGEGV